MIKAKQMIRRLMYDPEGRHTTLLELRSKLTKFAATRGWVIPGLTTRPGLAEKWKKAKMGDNIGYQHYLELTEGSRQLLNEIKSRVSVSDPILDLGCNVGRELNHLWQEGYRNLTGVEIGEEPVRAMREVFPELAAGARIINRSMTSAVLEFKDSEFELVYAHGSLISLNAREQFVYDEICRITRRWIIVQENEHSGMLFPRDFGKVFSWRGMHQVSELQIFSEVVKNGTVKKSTMRVFEKKR